MAHKRFGGWHFNKSLYLELSVANQLWGYARRDGRGEEQTKLLFIGWYSVENLPKLINITILWFSLDFGLHKKLRGWL